MFLLLFLKASYRTTWIVKILSFYLCVCLDKGLLTKILTVGGIEMIFTSLNCLTFYKKALYRFFFFFFRLPYLFIYGWAGSLLLHRLFSSCSEKGLLSTCGGFSSWVVSCCRAQALGAWALLAAVHGLYLLQHMGSAPGLESTGSEVVAHRFSCSTDCGFCGD